tara:strand:- start:2349 stop:2579 length:231 start_codon:yes stop_codon:yes gene_type:complete
VIFDGVRQNPGFFFNFISYELKKNILYIYLSEEELKGTYLQVESYPCIIFEINSNPDEIIVNIDYSNKKDKKSADN